jgi:hypothetical protein
LRAKNAPTRPKAHRMTQYPVPFEKMGLARAELVDLRTKRTMLRVASNARAIVLSPCLPLRNAPKKSEMPPPGLREVVAERGGTLGLGIVPSARLRIKGNTGLRTAATTGQSVDTTGSRTGSAWFPFSKTPSACGKSLAVRLKRNGIPIAP